MYATKAAAKKTIEKNPRANFFNLFQPVFAASNVAKIIAIVSHLFILSLAVKNIIAFHICHFNHLTITGLLRVH